MRCVVYWQKEGLCKLISNLEKKICLRYPYALILRMLMPALIILHSSWQVGHFLPYPSNPPPSRKHTHMPDSHGSVNISFDRLSLSVSLSPPPSRPLSFSLAVFLYVRCMCVLCMCVRVSLCVSVSLSPSASLCLAVPAVIKRSILVN